MDTEKWDEALEVTIDVQDGFSHGPCYRLFFGLSGLNFALAFSSANPAGASDTSRKVSVWLRIGFVVHV